MRRKQEVNSVKMSVEALTGEVEDGWDGSLHHFQITTRPFLELLTRCRISVTRRM